jgi:hypothetical protein
VCNLDVLHLPIVICFKLQLAYEFRGIVQHSEQLNNCNAFQIGIWRESSESERYHSLRASISYEEWNEMIARSFIWHRPADITLYLSTELNA